MWNHVKIKFRPSIFSVSILSSVQEKSLSISKIEKITHSSSLFQCENNRAHTMIVNLFFASFSLLASAQQQTGHSNNIFHTKRKWDDENSSQLSFGARASNTKSCGKVLKRERERKILHVLWNIIKSETYKRHIKGKA
jgi:hypothetical protein